MTTVAVIDDQTDAAEILKIVLTRANYAARLFTGGPEFLKCFRKGGFDLIVLDIALPGMDGCEIFDRIRMTDPNVPVIAFTAYAFPHDRENLLRRGFAAHVPKPMLDFGEFLNEVSRHLQKPRRPMKAS